MEEVCKSLSSLLQDGHHAEEKAKPTDLPKAPFLEGCSCRVLAGVGDTSVSQQEEHEKGNWCVEAREGSEGSSDGSVESALN